METFRSESLEQPTDRLLIEQRRPEDLESKNSLNGHRADSRIRNFHFEVEVIPPDLQTRSVESFGIPNTGT